MARPNAYRRLLVVMVAAWLTGCGGDDGVAPDRCAGVVCTAADACHTAGVCDPDTGACTAPVVDDGELCDDGDAATPLDACAAGTCVGLPFDPDAPWGPPGTPPPPGAQIVSVAEMAALAATDGFEPITAAGRAAAVAAWATRVSDARAMVLARLGAHPRYHAWFPPPGAPLPADLTPAPGDGYVTVDTDGTRYVLDGGDQKALDLAYSLTHTGERGNLEARYRALHDALPGDEQEGLPAPDALAATDDAELVTLLDELARRVDRAVPARTPLSEAADPGDLGCTLDPDALSNQPGNPGWQLRGWETPLRSQGNRGTCAAFAITAGVELAVKRKTGVSADLSEQELFARAKGAWFPTENAYGDGLVSSDVLEELVAHDHSLQPEARWTYNPSPHRTESDATQSYTDSCVDYDGYCSDSNHQQLWQCSRISGKMFCAWLLPPTVAPTGVGRVRVKTTVSLWNPLEPENSIAAIRAMVRAGHPVVIGATVDGNFRQGAKLATGAARGFVREPGGDELPEPASHAMVVVGSIWNGQLPPAYQGDPEVSGPGYLVVKNSWGCKGDAGHVYLSDAWARANIDAATAIVDVATDITAPTIKLAVDRSQVKTAGSVRFTITSNRAVTVVRLHRGLDAGDAISRTWHIDQPADGTVNTSDVVYTAADNGLHLFLARGEDAFGNVVASAVVGVLVAIDDVPPTVSLTASPATVFAPGAVTLTATAADAGGIARVQFLRGLSVIAQDTTPPFTVTVPLSNAALGVNSFAAFAYDNAGNQQASNIVPVTVIGGGVRPIVAAFTAAPQGLPPGGGPVTLSWQTLGATSVRIDPGVGVVAGSGSRTVTVTQSTTFTITATNAAGASTVDVPVVVAPLPAPVIDGFTATPATVPAAGGVTRLAWTVTGPVDTLAIDHGIGAVTGQTFVDVPIAATTTFTLTATNAGGTTTRQVTVTRLPDTTAPTVQLVASATQLAVPATLRLDAPADDDVGVVAVDFLRAGVVVATDATPADGFAAVLALGPGDVGTAAWTARAHDAAGNLGASAPVTIQIDGPLLEAPTIDGLGATPATVPAAGGDVTLSWLVTGLVTTATLTPGVGDVTGLDHVTVHVAATTTFTLTAANGAGSATRTVTVTVSPDTTAPTVTLQASATSVTAPATVTFTATATDDVAVTAVEFRRDGAVVATDGTAADGFTATIALGLGDLGSAAWTARAQDAAGNATTSAPVTVTVADPSRHVSPTGSDVGNTVCAAATPCLTIAHAAQVAGPGGTVVLHDGTYGVATQGATDVVVPGGVTVRAEHDRLAIVKVRLGFPAGGSLIGVHIDRTAPDAQAAAGVLVSGGAMVLESVDWQGQYAGVATSKGLEVTGTASVTVRPGLVTDYSALTTPAPGTSGAAPFLAVTDDASVVVEGGRFGGPGLGSQPTTVSNGAGAAVLLRNRARLTLRGATLVFDTSGVAILESSQLHLEAGARLQAGAIHGTSAAGAIQLERNVAGETPRAFVTDSIVDGDTGTARASACVFTTEAGTIGELTLTRAQVRGCGAGLRALVQTTLVVVATDSDVVANTLGGIECQGACNLDLTGGSVADNAPGTTGQRGGIWMGQTNVAYQLKLRGVRVTNNHGTVNVVDNSGLYLRGNASSQFDLGTAADPGGNVLQNNSAGTQSANVALNTAAGVVVSAVGNTWNPGAQGADGAGALAIGTVTSGTVINYRIIAGALATSN